MNITKQQLKQIIKEEIKAAIVEEGLGDWLLQKGKQAVNLPGRLASRYIADPIYDLTQSKDVPTYRTGPASKISKMQEPWEYKADTETEKTKFDTAMAIAGLMSVGLAGAGGAGAKGARRAALKAYLANKGLDAPTIALGTYTAYKIAMHRAGKKTASKAKWEAAKAALINLAMEVTPGGKRAPRLAAAAKTFADVSK